MDKLTIWLIAARAVRHLTVVRRLIELIDPVHHRVAVIGGLPKMYQHLRSTAVDLRHDTKLMGLFLGGSLIDTNSVYPKD